MTSSAAKAIAAATYTMLWPKHVVARCVDVVDGQPLRHILGRNNAQTNFDRFKIRPEDTIIPLHIDRGFICPIARMEVVFKGTVAAWNAGLPPMADELPIDCSHPMTAQVLVGEGGTPQHFFRHLPVEMVRLLRYDAAKGPRALVLAEDGRLIRHMGMDGVFRLTPESADEFGRFAAE